jgi:CBS domain containing-hemolysin-like protein
MSRLLLYFFAVLGISFLCSLLESFILSITHSHISLVVKDRPALGKKLSNFKENINRPLSAILSLNTIANTVGAASVGATALIEFGSSWVAIEAVAPTLAAPTVLAIVFKLRMADKGRLIFSLKLDNFFPNAGRSFTTKLI